MKTDSRLGKSKASVFGIKKLLTAIVLHPASFTADATLTNALKSQGALAKLEKPDYGITPTSLNTIKRASDKELNGGFDELNNLRIQALEKILNHNAQIQKTKKPTKASLQDQITTLRIELQQALQDLWHLTMAFERALAQGRHYAEKADSSSILDLCEKDQRDLRIIFSLCKQRVVRSHE